MGGAKALTREEKKVRLLQLFHENSEVFTLKELEKNGQKQKGIVSNTVKDILEELVSDGEVTMEKIGTSNYFWSFPSAAGATKQAALARAQGELATVETKLEEVNATIAQAKKGREDTAERRKLLAELQAVQEESKSLKMELDAFGAADPVKYERKTKAVGICKEAAQRWTDNTMVLMQYISGMNVELDPIKEQLGINDEWEDLQL